MLIFFIESSDWGDLREVLVYSRLKHKILNGDIAVIELNVYIENDQP